MSERQTFTVFYSWQSDLEGRANRNLIEDALEMAAKTLRADDSLHVEPVMDRDTAPSLGRPRRFPCVLARCNPANTRSRIRSLSNSASAARMDDDITAFDPCA